MFDSVLNDQLLLACLKQDNVCIGDIWSSYLLCSISDIQEAVLAIEVIVGTTLNKINSILEGKGNDLVSGCLYLYRVQR